MREKKRAEIGRGGKEENENGGGQNRKREFIWEDAKAVLFIISEFIV